MIRKLFLMACLLLPVGLRAQVTVSGNLTATAGQNQIVAYSVTGLTFVDGNKYTTVAAALAAVVTAGGGVIHAEGCSLASCLALGTLDVGNFTTPGQGKVVTIWLGPFDYTATQIVLRAGFGLIGMKNGDAGGTGTTITATSASTPVVVGPKLGSDFAAQHASIDNIRFVGAPSSTADGMFLDTAGIGSGGLGGTWYSQFHNNVFDSFGGVAIHIRGGGATGGTGQGVNQWLSFYDTTVFRTLGGGHAVKIEGANYQVFFYGGEYDSIYGNSNIDPSTTPNVYVGCGSCTSNAAEPYIIQFDKPTIQGAATLVQVDGANQVLFSHAHHEQGYGAYLISIPSTTYSDNNIIVRDASFNGTVGVHSGSGYLMNVTASRAMGIALEDSTFPGNGVTPDHYFENTGGAPISCCDVLNLTVSNSANNWPAKPLPTTTNVGRVGFVNGTELTTSAFAFGTGWGTSPVFNSARGTDALFVLTFTAGSGSPTAGAYILLAPVDGTWTNPPICVFNAAAAGTANASPFVESGTSTATSITIVAQFTPAAGQQYQLTGSCGQSPN